MDKHRSSPEKANRIALRDYFRIGYPCFKQKDRKSVSFDKLSRSVPGFSDTLLVGEEACRC